MEKSKHGMTSELARFVKKTGHLNEEKIANLENAQVIKGNGKCDIINENNQKYSVKTGKKTQWGLYCLETLLQYDWTKEQRKSLEEYVNFLPDSKEDYLKSRIKYKINPFAKNLYLNFEKNPIKLIKFFCGFGEIDFFYLTDIRDNKSYKIESEVFFSKIESSIKSTYTTNGGKLVISGGKKNIILFELEMRKGTNHKKILFHSLLSRIIDIVKE